MHVSAPGRPDLGAGASRGPSGPAPRSARSSGNRRARHLTREHVPLADVLAGQVTCSRPGGAPSSPSGRRGARHGRRPSGGRPSARGPGGAVCPNLLQRPRSRRSAGRESLIFRASSRGRSRRGAPLQQIWTRSRPGSFQKPHPPHRVKGFTPGRTGTGRHSDPTPGGKGPSFGRHSNTTRSAGPGLSAPAPRTFVIEGLRTRVPIPGELPPSPERPASGSLRPSAVSARTRSSGSPTLASPPVRRQPLCNPTTLNTHPPNSLGNVCEFYPGAPLLPLLHLMRLLHCSHLISVVGSATSIVSRPCARI